MDKLTEPTDLEQEVAEFKWQACDDCEQSGYCSIPLTNCVRCKIEWKLSLDAGLLSPEAYKILIGGK